MDAVGCQGRARPRGYAQIYGPERLLRGVRDEVCCPNQVLLVKAQSPRSTQPRAAGVQLASSACPCAVGARPTLRWWSAAKQRCCRRTRQVLASYGVPHTRARCSAGCLSTEPPAESSTSQDQAAPPPHG